MTPTLMPRDWDRVDTTLAGVIAFGEVDRLVANVAETYPLHVAETRRLTAEVPTHRSDAKKRLRQAHALRSLTAEALDAVRKPHAGLLVERRQLRRRVFWLRVQSIWLRFVFPTLRGFVWALTALPRLAWWLGQQVARPFRRREPARVREADDDYDPRSRFG